MFEFMGGYQKPSTKLIFNNVKIDLDQVGQTPFRNAMIQKRTKKGMNQLRTVTCGDSPRPLNIVKAQNNLKDGRFLIIL